MNYLDISYLLKIYACEHGTQEVVAWMTGRRDFICSRHGRLEVISGLKRHQREGRLDARGLRLSLQQLAEDESQQVVVWLPIGNELIDRACTRVAAFPSRLFLRAADALHLACAAEHGCKEIYSHDRHLLAAAPHFGLRGIDVITSP